MAKKKKKTAKKRSRMAMPSVAPKVFVVGTPGQFRVEPGTAFARAQDTLEFKNLTGYDAWVVCGAFTDFFFVSSGGTEFATVDGNAQGVYEYAVMVGDRWLAEGHSAPRIIIDG